MPGNGRPLSARAYAKLNLTLQILHKRPDGYHEIESLVQRIDLCDTVTLRPLDPGEEDRVICEPPVFIPAGKKENTVCEALGALRSVLSECGYPVGMVLAGRAEASGVEGGFGPVEARILKRIPEGAGLGGASADAACTLVLASRLWNLRPDISLLARAASIVGSDVPVCLYGPLNIIRGRGEQVIPLAPLRPFWAIVAFPGRGISTADAYARWDSLHPPQSGWGASETTQGAGALSHGGHRYLNVAVNAITEGDLRALGEALRNDFEEVALELVPKIGEIKSGMLKAGAVGASVTGSGSAVFGLWAREEEARQALDLLSGLFADNGVRLTLVRSLSY